MISLQDVTKQYPDGTVAVHDLTLEIDEGVICALVGPSGCGKTTTMRMINRLIEPTSGTIQVNGDDVTALDVQELRRRIGYVIQNAGLFPHYTVRKNVATVCRLLGWDKPRISSTSIRTRSATATLTNCPVVNASVSAWHGRWRPIHLCC